MLAEGYVEGISNPRRGVLRALSKALLTLFVIATLVVPASPVNKVLFAVLLALICSALVLSRGGVVLKTFSPFIILAIFLYGYVVANTNPVERELSNQFLLTASVLFIIYLVNWYQIDLDKIVMLGGVTLTLFTTLLFVLIFMLGDAAAPLFEYFTTYSLGAVGEREFGDSPIFMFHAGTVPFLFLPFCLFLNSYLAGRQKRDLVILILMGLVITVSTSRALLLACIAASIYITSRTMQQKTRIVFTCLILVVGIFVVDYVISKTYLFSAAESSNAVKIGHAKSFWEHLTPTRLIFGEGLAAYYYSLGRNIYLAHTEIVPLDMIRYVGFPATVLLFGAIVLPSLRARYAESQNRMAVVLLALYLSVSLTNPVLFNSYGLLIVLWYWSKVLDVSRRTSNTSTD